jgi:hypothetical protein
MYEADSCLPASSLYKGRMQEPCHPDQWSQPVGFYLPRHQSAKGERTRQMTTASLLLPFVHHIPRIKQPICLLSVKPTKSINEISLSSTIRTAVYRHAYNPPLWGPKRTRLERGSPIRNRSQADVEFQKSPFQS